MPLAVVALPAAFAIYYGIAAVLALPRKAEPVAAALTGPIATACPASALRTISRATIYLEPDSARLLPV